MQQAEAPSRVALQEEKQSVTLSGRGLSPLPDAEMKWEGLWEGVGSGQVVERLTLTPSG